MLKNKLYKISSTEKSEEGKYIVNVIIDPAHEIFTGHFPNQPVLPGVCLLEMTKEIISELKDKSLLLKSASSIKYPRLVDPTVDSELQFDLSLTEENDLIMVNVSSSLKDGSANFKMKGNFAPAE